MSDQSLPTILDLEPLRADAPTLGALRARLEAEKVIDLCKLHASGLYPLSKDESRMLGLLLARVLPPLPEDYTGQHATPEKAAIAAATSGTNPEMTKFVLTAKHGWAGQAVQQAVPFVVVVPESLSREEWERRHGRALDG